MFDVYKIRKDFPVLMQNINGKPNIYLDSAASAQKPDCVIDKMCRVYKTTYANVHRGVYALADEITAEYEDARQTVQKFINAASAKEIVFTRNATESINLVAATWALDNLHGNDEILLSEAEHHANLIPWQIVAQKTGCTLKIFKIGDDGSYLPEEFTKNLNGRTKLVAITGMSNVLGTIFPVKDITTAAHQIGAKVLIDACQLAVHQPIDVQDIDCDFLAFSGHKTYGPTGIGVLYGKFAILQNLPPYQTGGDMVEKVTYQKTTYAEPPARFEAGTPAIMQAVGLGHAIDYVNQIGMNEIDAHERALCRKLQQAVGEIQGVRIIGTSDHKAAVVSFVTDFAHPQDLSMVLDQEGVAVRTGHHCAQPLHERFGVSVSVRASLGVYNTDNDIEGFIRALDKAKRFFA